MRWCTAANRMMAKGLTVMAEAVYLRREDGSEPRHEHLGDWIDQLLGTNYHKYRPADMWKPAINLYEAETHYCLVVELAGVDASDIDFVVEGGMMIISGQRATPEPAEICGAIRLRLMEIEHGRFCREVQLPDDVELDGIKACYRSGYLWIRLPRIS